LDLHPPNVLTLSCAAGGPRAEAVATRRRQASMLPRSEPHVAGVTRRLKVDEALQRRDEDGPHDGVRPHRPLVTVAEAEEAAVPRCLSPHLMS